MKVQMKTKYNVTNECGNPIEENANLKQARTTVKLNPGSKFVKAEVKK